ncbi:MAG: phosphoglucomutase/phosphomannomutase family protein [Flavobacteriales bacterium]|nr:phosphoglucomutase/phosphomannomutase family protein [Flavobacteriales bacterium]
MNRTIHFGTDGWRAIIAKEFTVENVARLTYGLSRWVKEQAIPDRVVIGYDCRFGGKLFSQAASTVLLSEGIEVLLSDRIVTTPMLAMAARDLKCAAGLMITASHNSPVYNGYKLKSHLGGPMGDKPLRIIESYTPSELDVEWELIDISTNKGFSEIDIETPYISAIHEAFDVDRIWLLSSNIVYDAMYGSGQFVMKKLFPEMIHFRSEHNPTFYGLSPEPIARNLKLLAEFVNSNSDVSLGLITDGDADRIGMMDGGGNFIDSHHIILLLIHYLVKYKGQRGKVVTAFSTVNKVRKLCEIYDLPLEIVKIGFKYASEIMTAESVMLAGEESGGIAMETHIPERDGIWMGMMLLEFITVSEKNISELIQEVYDMVGPFVFKRRDLRLSNNIKDSVVKKCQTNGIRTIGNRPIEKVEDLDGWKFILDENTWIMIRPSGTEPVLRIYVEAEDESTAEMLLSDINDLIDSL